MDFSLCDYDTGSNVSLIRHNETFNTFFIPFEIDTFDNTFEQFSGAMSQQAENAVLKPEFKVEDDDLMSWPDPQRFRIHALEVDAESLPATKRQRIDHEGTTVESALQLNTAEIGHEADERLPANKRQRIDYEGEPNERALQPNPAEKGHDTDNGVGKGKKPSKLAQRKKDLVKIYGQAKVSNDVSYVQHHKWPEDNANTSVCVGKNSRQCHADARW